MSIQFWSSSHLKNLIGWPHRTSCTYTYSAVTDFWVHVRAIRVVVFHCEKWFGYQTWFKARLLRFFFRNFRFLILLIKNKVSLKLSHFFQFEVFLFSEKMKIIDFSNSDFWKLLRPMLIQFSKFNNFLWVCWFLGKNLSSFVPPVWKLHYSYCHTFQTIAISAFMHLQ